MLAVSHFEHKQIIYLLYIRNFYFNKSYHAIHVPMKSYKNWFSSTDKAFSPFYL